MDKLLLIGEVTPGANATSIKDFVSGITGGITTNITLADVGTVVVVLVLVAHS